MLTKSVVARSEEAPARSAYSVSECTSTRPPRPGVRVISDAYADWISKSDLDETNLPSIVPGTTVCTQPSESVTLKWVVHWGSGNVRRPHRNSLHARPHHAAPTTSEVINSFGLKLVDCSGFVATEDPMESRPAQPVGTMRREVPRLALAQEHPRMRWAHPFCNDTSDWTQVALSDINTDSSKRRNVTLMLPSATPVDSLRSPSACVTLALVALTKVPFTKSAPSRCTFAPWRCDVCALRFSLRPARVWRE